MWQKIKLVLFTIPELRNKIWLTLGLLAIYRIGWWIRLPIIDPEKVKQAADTPAEGLGQMLETAAMFSASQLSEATIFGLGIMPYISASILFQLLASFWKPLEELQKEGESGRKKINEYTRYATVVICVFQSWVYLASFVVGDGRDTLALGSFLTDAGSLKLQWMIYSVLMMTAGTLFLMWLGEQIDEFGIGNGISLLIMAGILARLPSSLISLFNTSKFQLGAGRGEMGVETILVLATLFVLVIMAVIFMTEGQRQIPTQTGKHVRGRRVFGGAKQYLPLRLNQSGVMPIVFASSLLMFPAMLLHYLANTFPNVGLLNDLADSFDRGTSFTYNACFIGLIFFFCYFWTALSFNPKDIADNLKSYGAFIPGYRPGRPTANYLEKVMGRITYVGAAFLSLVAILPTLVASVLDVPYGVAAFFGGTGLLIAVNVAFDLVRKINSHLVMRNYEGLLQ